MGKGFHTPTERTENGVKNKIYHCFIDYFGDIESWNLPEQWIDSMCDKRNEIVHGGENTTIEAINTTTELIPVLEQTSKVLFDKIIECYFNRREFIHLEF